MPPRPLQVVFFFEQEENQQKEFGLRHLRDPVASSSIPHVFSPCQSLQVVVQKVELLSQLLSSKSRPVFSFFFCFVIVNGTTSIFSR